MCDWSEGQIAQVDTFTPQLAIQFGMRHLLYVEQYFGLELQGAKSMEDSEVHASIYDLHEEAKKAIMEARKGNYAPAKTWYTKEGMTRMEYEDEPDEVLATSGLFNLANALPERDEPFTEQILNNLPKP